MQRQYPLICNLANLLTYMTINTQNNTTPHTQTGHQQPHTNHHNLHTPHHTHKSMLCISGIVKDIEGYTQEEEKAEGYAHTTHTMIFNVHIHVHPTTPNTQHTTCKYSDKHRNGVSHMSLVSVGYKWHWCAYVYLLYVSVYNNLTFTYNITKVKHHRNNPNPNPNSYLTNSKP